MSPLKGLFVPDPEFHGVDKPDPGLLTGVHPLAHHPQAYDLVLRQIEAQSQTFGKQMLTLFGRQSDVT